MQCSLSTSPPAAASGQTAAAAGCCAELLSFLRDAVDTRKAPLMEVALDCIQKLISFKLLQGPVHHINHRCGSPPALHGAWTFYLLRCSVNCSVDVLSVSFQAGPAFPTRRLCVVCLLVLLPGGIAPRRRKMTRRRGLWWILTPCRLRCTAATWKAQHMRVVADGISLLLLLGTHSVYRHTAVE